MPWPNCDVCEKGIAAAVASSGLGPISFTFCTQCLDHRAEPAWMVRSLIMQVGGVDALCPEVLTWGTYADGQHMTIAEYLNRWPVTQQEIDEMMQEYERYRSMAVDYAIHPPEDSSVD